MEYFDQLVSENISIRDRLALISLATPEEIERGEAIRVPGTDIYIHPKRCGMIVNIEQDGRWRTTV